MFYKRKKKNAGCADVLPWARLANDTKKKQPFMFSVNGCFFFKTIAVVIVFFSAKGKELTFKSLVLVGYVVIKILENQSIKPTR